MPEIIPSQFTLDYPLRPSGNYMKHLLWQSLMLHFVFIGFVGFSLQTAIISLNSVNQLIFVMVKCGVLFEVRTEFLNNI
jgi:D-alanyl-lipoteichoic acid acyltransferase DltB (MBOAT superfamily)